MGLPKEITASTVSPIKLTVLWTLGLLCMNFIFVSAYLLYDFSQYKTAFYQQQTHERAEANSKIEAVKKSAESFLSLIASRIEADLGNLEKVQKILSSCSQIASDLELPGILNASYLTYSKPFVKVTRFGAQPVDGFTPLDNSIKAKVTLRNDLFKVTRAISGQYAETAGFLTITFDKNKLLMGLGGFETINPKQPSTMEGTIVINGVNFYSNAPAEFWEYGTQNINKYFVFAFFSLLSTLSIFALYIALHRRFERKYGKLISKLKLDIEGFVHSEFDNQNYRTAQTTLKRIRSLLAKRQLEQIQHVYTCLDHLVTSQSDPGYFLSEEDGLKLITMCTSSLETMAMGLISPLAQEDVELPEIIDIINELFADRLYKNEITLKADYPDNFIIPGDRAFILLVLVNLIGKSIFRVQPLGKVVVKASLNESSTSVEITDTAPSINFSTEKLITDSFELFVDNRALVSVCDSLGISIPTKRIRKKNVTTLNLPVPSSENIRDNVVPLFQ